MNNQIDGHQALQSTAADLTPEMQNIIDKNRNLLSQLSPNDISVIRALKLPTQIVLKNFETLAVILGNSVENLGSWEAI